MNILIIGNCGVGKTYLMQQIKKQFDCSQNKNVELLHYVTNEHAYNENVINIAGKFDGSTFQGTDRLSMSVMTSLPTYLQTVKGINIYEGDRFTNGKFIAKAKPFIIKIKGDGKLGRESRGSTQSDRQIKSISTRVSNIKADAELDDSKIAEVVLLDILSRKDYKTALEQLKDVYKPTQRSLF